MFLEAGVFDVCDDDFFEMFIAEGTLVVVQFETAFEGAAVADDGVVAEADGEDVKRFTA